MDNIHLTTNEISAILLCIDFTLDETKRVAESNNKGHLHDDATILLTTIKEKFLRSLE